MSGQKAWRAAFWMIPSAVFLSALVWAYLSVLDGRSRALVEASEARTDLDSFKMQGGLYAFWNVNDGSRGSNRKAAEELGFSPISILNTYADYPGQQTQNITKWLQTHSNDNPWLRPPFFESVVRRNVGLLTPRGPIVHDIEFEFEQDAMRAYEDPAIRGNVPQGSFSQFRDAYFREWAKWFWAPLKITKQLFPHSAVGIYGPQPFRRDYYGLAGKSAQQIDGTHAMDDLLWQYIDPYVDFYIASIYVFYSRPDSVFYIASNVEENYRRTRKYGNKPLYAYAWLRFHQSNRLWGGQELDPYLVEAMAIVPYFTGARGVVLWGFEPKSGAKLSELYKTLPNFVNALARVARLSKLISEGRIRDAVPASELWTSHAPLIRVVDAVDGSCVVMATNPWQGSSSISSETVTCAGMGYPISMFGQGISLVRIKDGHLTLH